MEITYRKVGELVPYVNNARTHSDEQVAQICASIREYGWTNPVLIDENGMIIAGHGRVMAAQRMKMDEVPCIVLSGLTEAQKKDYVIADNKMALNAGWDDEKLKLELENLKELDFNLELTGFDSDELDQLLSLDDIDDLPEDIDEIPEPPREAKSKLGDIYKLGEHTLMCGDSTKEEDVSKIMGGEFADMFFCDPPYGMKKENDGIENDNLNFDDLLEFNKKWIKLSFEYLKKVGSWYCWGIDEPLMDIYSEILRPMKKLHGQDKLTFRNLITWDKGNGQGQLSPLHRKYAVADEKCLFVMMGRQTYGETIDDYWDGFEPLRQKLENEKKKTGLSTQELCKLVKNSSLNHWWSKSQWFFPNEEAYKALQNALRNKEYDGFHQEYDELRQEYDELRQEWYKTRAYFDNTHDNMNDVWHFNRVVTGVEGNEDQWFATIKPIALCSRAIKSSSREGDLVVDLFGGSGSTLIACEQLKRRCKMMELDPINCDNIIERWERFTGRKAVKVNG